jgi:hypothetical protein
MGPDPLGGEMGELLGGPIGRSESSVLVVNPSEMWISTAITTLSGESDPPAVWLLASEESLKWVMGDFIIGSRAADLIAADTLSLRSMASPPRNSLVVGDSAVVSLVYSGGTVKGLSTDDDQFVERVRSHYEDVWDDAEPFSHRTPPLSRVYETLEDDIGADVARDFETVLDALDVARGDGDGLDEVTISLLVAARNGVLLYDISRWGEDVGVASKATFSRTKTALEDSGLIATEKVPIDVGRPRLRLELGDERLQDATAADLPSVAQSLLTD